MLIREFAHPDPALEPYLQHPIDLDMLWVHEYTKAPVEGHYAHISDVLTPEALALMDKLPVPPNGKCSTDIVEQHPVAGPLARTMGRISLFNRINSPDANKIQVSLRHEARQDMVLDEHRDFLDGHAVIFNWDVQGDLHYTINGRRPKIDSNEIIVISGCADFVAIDGLVLPPNEDKGFGFATKPHGVVGVGSTSRKRLLVYADGAETVINQIAA